MAPKIIFFPPYQPRGVTAGNVWPQRCSARSAHTIGGRFIGVEPIAAVA